MITSRGFAQDDPIDVAPPDEDRAKREKRTTGLQAASNAIRGGWEHDLPRVLDMLGLREQT